jgi:hypothetical protein
MKISKVVMTCSISVVLGGALTLVRNNGEGVAHASGNAAAARQCINSCNQQWSQCEQSCNGDFNCSVGCDTAKLNCTSYCQTL